VLVRRDVDVDKWTSTAGGGELVVNRTINLGLFFWSHIWGVALSNDGRDTRQSALVTKLGHTMDRWADGRSRAQATSHIV